MTKIDVISGFLGAGKTTLIKKLIKDCFKNEKLVLIENEFGEIGIDGGFLKEGGIEITEMNSGCICCSLVGDFGTALKDVLARYQPDRILIEPSGVGKLSDVIKAVQNVEEEIDIELNAKIAVVDAVKCSMYMKNFGEFFNNQIEHASCIILSRTQKISQEKLEQCVALIRKHNETATIVTTSWDEISGEKLLEAIEKAHSLEIELMQKQGVCPSCQEHHISGSHDECCNHHANHKVHHHEGCNHDHAHAHEDHACCHHSHQAEEVFTSWGIETPLFFSKENIQSALEILAHTNQYGHILRAKGIVQNEAGDWFGFDLVPGEYEIRQEAPDYTGKLCVIGTQLDEEGLKTLFKVNH